MKCFLLLAPIFTGINGIALPPTGLSNSLLPRNVSPDSQLSSLHTRQFLDEEAPNDSLWLDTEGFTDAISDPLLFADNNDFASSPIVFDEASAAACDDTQSSLDSTEELFGLNARDLSDEFPDLQNLVTPLQKLQDSRCSAFTNQQQGSKKGTQTQTPDKDLTEEPQGPSRDTQRHIPIPPGICPMDYHYPLCCNGQIIGMNVTGCGYCEYFPASGRRGSSVPSFAHFGTILSLGKHVMPDRKSVLLRQFRYRGKSYRVTATLNPPNISIILQAMD